MAKRETLVGGNHYHVWWEYMPMGIGKYNAKDKIGVFTQSYKLKDKEGYREYTIHGNYWILATDKEVEEFYKETEEFHNY